MKEIEQNFKEDSIIYQPFTEATAQAFDNEQKHFDNVKYQREDTQAACELLGIPWAGDKTRLLAHSKLHDVPELPTQQPTMRVWFLRRSKLAKR